MKPFPALAAFDLFFKAVVIFSRCRGGLHALPQIMFDLFSAFCACAGKGFMPFLIQCSTYFLKRLGHFLWKGIKPFPALAPFSLFFKSVLFDIIFPRKAVP